mmetsp:Transcript_4319/g.8710  ORF Transcript_4319/g.8710 Transcript_4319/m.8710 type:complete len:204 (+) Transcript_4319:465-1076(+)
MVKVNEVVPVDRPVSSRLVPLSQELLHHLLTGGASVEYGGVVLAVVPLLYLGDANVPILALVYRIEGLVDDEEPVHAQVAPESLHELLEAHCAAPVLIKVYKNILKLLRGHLYSHVNEAVLHLSAGEVTCSIVVHRLQQSAQAADTVNSPSNDNLVAEHRHSGLELCLARVARHLPSTLPVPSVLQLLHLGLLEVLGLQFHLG